MRENVIVVKIISVKQVGMLLQDVMNIVTEVKIHSHSERRFNWKIFRRVQNKVSQRKIHEAYYVMCMRPTLKNQLELTFLKLFQDGVTLKNAFKLLLV